MRVSGVVVGAGVLHLLVPGVLLAVAASLYRRVLAVDFRPRPGARARVRVVGVGMVVVGLALRRVET
jgi:hypothetical protein